MGCLLLNGAIAIYLVIPVCIIDQRWRDMLLVADRVRHTYIYVELYRVEAQAFCADDECAQAF